jgi:hypothetical protein
MTIQHRGLHPDRTVATVRHHRLGPTVWLEGVVGWGGWWGVVAHFVAKLAHVVEMLAIDLRRRSLKRRRPVGNVVGDRNL